MSPFWGGSGRCWAGGWGCSVDIGPLSIAANGVLTYDPNQVLELDPNNVTGLLDGTTIGSVGDHITRNDFGEVVEYTASVGMPLVMSVSYVRDKVGRTEKKTEMLDGDLGSTDTFYKYDQAGRLYRVCDDDDCLSVRAEYDYDLNSNRTGGFTASGAIEADYDEQDRLLSYATTSGQVTTTTTYTYTANGELETKTTGSDVTGYQYDALGNLRHVDLPIGDDIDYVIDGKDRRIGKKINGTLVQALLYEDQLRPVAEINASGTVVSRFVYGDKVNVPEYMVKGGATYRIVTDHLGSPRLVIKTDDGTIAQRMDYDEWGNVLADSNPGFQPFGFAGGLWDADTGLMRFGARDYDPRTGRWTAKDPIGFAANVPNLFLYSLQDPVNQADSSGLASLSQYIKVFNVMAAVFSYLANPPEVPPRVIRRRTIRPLLQGEVRKKLSELHKALTKQAVSHFVVPNCLWIVAAEKLSEIAMSAASKGTVLDDTGCEPDAATGELPPDCVYYDDRCPPPWVNYNWSPGNG